MDSLRGLPKALAEDELISEIQKAKDLISEANICLDRIVCSGVRVDASIYEMRHVGIEHGFKKIACKFERVIKL